MLNSLLVSHYFIYTNLYLNIKSILSLNSTFCSYSFKVNSINYLYYIWLLFKHLFFIQ